MQIPFPYTTDNTGTGCDKPTGEPKSVNKFEALCRLASKEQWCWKLNCTTCGHMYFRYGFREIAKGRVPEGEDWLVYTQVTAGSDSPQREQLGRLPYSYSSEEKDRVLKICLEADILAIARDCRFPDWLGYLGLVLHHMKTDARIYGEVSAKWARQLKALVGKRSWIYSRLEEIAAGDRLPLNIQDLEQVESARHP